MDEKTYTLNDLAMMTGFTTRTLRNYLLQGLLKGEKIDGVWRFTPQELETFFAEPFVKEGLRIKHSAAVFDFLADKHKKENRICIILDLPTARKEGQQISSFFCEQMNRISDTTFTFDWDHNFGRVILSGAEDQVMKILEAYNAFRLEN